MWIVLLLWLCLVSTGWAATGTVPPPGFLDLNTNGVSDVWEVLYNTTSFDLEYDSDGDSLPNRSEAVAGTDPRSGQSAPRITGYRMTPEGFAVTLSSARGKQMILESAEYSRGNPITWTQEGSAVARISATVTVVAPADRLAKIFRMSVSDVDTDNDGLSDWEEYQLGLNPLGSQSNGRSDGYGRPISDYAYITNRLGTESLTSLLAARLKLNLGTTLFCGPIAAANDPFAIAASEPTGTGLTGEYYTNSSSTYTNPLNFNLANLFLTTNNSIIDFDWGPALTPNLSNGNYSVRWTGQVEPQYSENYVFETRTDDGVKLWVNDQLLIDRWQLQGTATWTNGISLQAGVRYNLRMEYFNRGGSARARLSWYSPNQPRQVIPSLRLYPFDGGLAPGGVTSPAYAVAYVGQPFTYMIGGANSPLSYDATNLPPGLSVNVTNGLISGVPSLAGRFAVGLVVSNVIGVANGVLDLEVFDTGSAVTREVWLNVTGTSVTNIPRHLPASSTNALGNLEMTNYGDNYGERIRGYLIPPVSGNYYFWLAANSTAELWISNDDEPVNAVRRAVVTKPTLARQWNASPGQRSSWLALRAGQRYYIEILHKAGTGSDHWSVGWLQDSFGTNTTPGGIVPGYVLAPYVETVSTNVSGTLYSANMVAQSGAISSGVGSATLRVSTDESQAVLRFSYAGLSAQLTGKHIHADTYKGRNPQGQIIFDLDTATPEVDGSYVWTIGPSGALSAADILEIIKEGKAYINIHSAAYPAGEINGHFGLAAGTSRFTAPPPAPTWIDDHSSSNAAARFLAQATFGPSPTELKMVRAMGYSKWIDKQFKLRVTGHLTNVLRNPSPDPLFSYPASLTFNTWWQQSVTAPDQLRQRVAFALSQILVVSEEGVLEENARALSGYYDVLLRHSFGNFRELLEAVTLSPAMGLYLDMRRNDKENLVTGTHPNENYAREILQLFSVGLNRTWPDGTLILNSRGDLVPTYDQDVIIGYARVFTGWNYWQTNQANKRLPSNWNPSSNYTNAMVLVPSHHEPGGKRLLDNIVLPAAQGAAADSSTTNFDAYGLRDMESALDSIFLNENVGPFICRQLIQRMVTSHPSRDYVYRVVQKFNDNGRGVRGDMQAVIKAILLDYEARGTNLLAQPTFGKQREPLLRATTLARALSAPPPLKGSYKQNGSQTITVTTGKPHRLGSSDDVYLVFSGKPAPASRIYNNVAVSNANTFTVSAPGTAAGTYGQSGTTITVTNSSHGLSVGHRIYLTFTSGGAASGIYLVGSVPGGSSFTVTATTSTNRAGTCYFPRWTGGGFSQSGTNVTVTTTGPHGLTPGKDVYIDFPSTSPDGIYRVVTVPAPNRFTVFSTVSGSTAESDPLVLPLIAAPITRSGSVTIRYSTWNMNTTDGGFSSSLSQTPLNSPTVFNYFFPDYKFPGILAAAGLTTPEFQLTSDTTAILQMNFMTGGFFNNGSNTNGLSSFVGGNGSIAVDLGPWMTPTWTDNSGIPGLIDSLSTLLCAGQLSPSARNIIVGYVADNARFPLASPAPTSSQMRDRVRATVHLIVSSPEFIIQR